MEEIYGSLVWATGKAMEGYKLTHNTFNDYEYVIAENGLLLNQNKYDVTSSIEVIDIYKNGWTLLNADIFCDGSDTPAMIRLFEYPLYDIDEEVWIITEGKVIKGRVIGHKVSYMLNSQRTKELMIEYKLRYKSGGEEFMNNNEVYASKKDVIANAFEE